MTALATVATRIQHDRNALLRSASATRRAILAESVLRHARLIAEGEALMRQLMALEERIEVLRHEGPRVVGRFAGRAALSSDCEDGSTVPAGGASECQS